MFEGDGYERGALRDAATGEVLVGQLVIARSRSARKKGLLGLEGLGSDTGLLLPDPLVHMVGMKFALDLVFISRSSEVVKVCADVTPGVKAKGTLRAKWCLELAAGQAAAAGLRPGLKLAFP